MTTPMERVRTAMAQREPDRVPLFLFAPMHAAQALGLRIRDYYARVEHMVEGQLHLLSQFGGDCLQGTAYAAAEAEAFGAETIFIDDGPPNCGAPTIRHSADIDTLRPPDVAQCPSLTRSLEVIQRLKARVGENVPILGSVVSPFSLPVMQMGFERYLDLIHEEPERFAHLMAVNQRFCVQWANAQLAAGATAIGYADPLASPANIPRDLYLRTGHPVAIHTMARIHGPTAIHLASARGLGIAEDIVATGTAGVAVSTLEDMADWKAAVGGRLTLVGNLNGIAMRRWTAVDAEREVKRAIAAAGRGGGFVLSDNHGEIPCQVPDEVLLAIRAAAERWGRYPLDWIG